MSMEDTLSYLYDRLFPSANAGEDAAIAQGNRAPASTNLQPSSVEGVSGDPAFFPAEMPKQKKTKLVPKPQPAQAQVAQPPQQNLAAAAQAAKDRDLEAKKQMLISQGKSPEEAESILQSMNASSGQLLPYSKTENHSTSTERLAYPSVMPEGDVNDANAALKKYREGSVKSLQNNIDLQGMYRKILENRPPPQMDLSPLYDYAHRRYGVPLPGGKAPETPEQIQEQFLKEIAAGENVGNRTTTAESGANKLLFNNSGVSNTLLDKLMQTEGFTTKAGTGVTPYSKLADKFYTQNKPTLDSFTSLNNAASAILSNTVTGQQELKNFLASLGRERVTEQAVARFSGNQEMGTQFDRLYNQFVATGKPMLPKDIADIRHFIQSFNRAHQFMVDQQTHNYAMSASQAEGLDPVLAENMLRQRFGSSKLYEGNDFGQPAKPPSSKGQPKAAGSAPASPSSGGPLNLKNSQGMSLEDLRNMPRRR